MAAELTEDQIDIIQDFIQESREMIDQLEPTIIELGQSCQKVNCWEILECTQADCMSRGHGAGIPCWLEAGYLGEGRQSCFAANSPQDCLDCEVFRLTNGDRETMNAIFRLFHSMKGSAGFLDLNHISRVAHGAENLLDLIRSGKIEMVPEHVDLLCRSCDFSKAAMEFLEEHFSDQGMADDAEVIAAQLRGAIDQSTELVQKKDAVTTRDIPDEASAAPADIPPSTAPHEPAVTPDDAGDNQEFVMPKDVVEQFVLEADEALNNIEDTLHKWHGPVPTDEVMAELSRLVHTFKVNSGLMGLEDLESLGEQMETVLESVRSGVTIKDVEPALLLAELNDLLRTGVVDLADGGNGKVEDLDQHLLDVGRLLRSRLGDLLLERGILDEESLQQALQQQKKPLGKILMEMGKVEQKQLDTILLEQETRRTESKKPAATTKVKAPVVKRQDIRVDLEKLDVLINLIGEIVIAQNIVLFNPDLQGLELDNFSKAGTHLSKLVRELQELAMTIRMIPVSGLFRRMMRLVHDLSVKSGKKVELNLIGEDTELDKTVIETITDPLVHLVRNSVDHGLESPEERTRTGKPEKGSVVLSARHKEGEVWISLEDDGKGLNQDKILAKAVSRGLIEGAGSELSPSALANLIFQPGFSTADQVTEISGRGVGLDVVRQNIEKINGRIEVNSSPGHGTRFDLRIPLTLGIIDGMLIRVGSSRCILPMLSIRESLCPTESMIRITPDGSEIIRVRENFFTVIRLHQILRHDPDSPKLSDGTVILLNYQDNRYCLFVDEIIGQQQTVIKGVPDFLGQVVNFSGCTILGDGEVCLILDIVNVIASYEARGREPCLETRHDKTAAAQQKNESSPTPDA